jgi:hypothetical protein
VELAVNRNFQFNEWAGPTTSTSFFATAALTPTWTPGDRYLVIGTVAAGVDITAFEVEIFGVYSYSVAVRDSVNDRFSCPMIAPYTAQGAGELFELFINPIGGAAATARQAFLGVFKMLECDLANDYILAGSSTNSTTFETVTNSTVTITEPGDYLVLACAKTGKDETTANFNMRLAVNGTTGYGDQTMRANSVIHFLPWAAMQRLTLAAGDVLTIEHKVSTTGSVSTTQASVVAIRIDTLGDVVEAEDMGDDTNTSTYIAKPGLNDIFPSRAFLSLMLSCGRYRRGSGSQEASVRTTYDGVVVQESRNESPAGGSEAVHFCAKGVTPTVAQHIIQQQFQQEPGGLIGAILSDAAVALIGMASDATVRILGNATLRGKTTLGK